MNYRERYIEWLDASFDEATRKELTSISDESELKDRFSCDLEFGTGGIRGIMGAGPNRLNKYVVRRATKGLADYLLAEYGQNVVEKGMAIAYDSRHNSYAFAMEAAMTLCAAGIHAYLFSEIMPTPVLSFSIPYLGCAGGIVITASHNPKEYNGYKVYDDSGCQIVPKISNVVSSYINRISTYSNIPILDSEKARKTGLLIDVDRIVLEVFLNEVQKQAGIRNKKITDALSIVYTPLHGAGKAAVMETLARAGYSNVTLLTEQSDFDGDFPTVISPNPEEHEALRMAIEKAKYLNADVVLGTDPDSDRVGVAVRHNNDYRLLSGNQIGALLIEYLIEHPRNTTKKQSAVIKTIVTGELGAEIARAHGLDVINTLTGFKYIGEKINELERNNRSFLIGYEESFGFLVGEHARDKDAVVSSMLICEMAAMEKARGRTLVDALENLFKRYGFYLDALTTFTIKNTDQNNIVTIMDKMRITGADEIGNVRQINDYSLGLDGLPSANVIKYILTDGSWLAVRPSGTEPKVKVYYSVKAENKQSAEIKLCQLQKIVRGVITG